MHAMLVLTPHFLVRFAAALRARQGQGACISGPRLEDTQSERLWSTSVEYPFAREAVPGGTRGTQNRTGYLHGLGQKLAPCDSEHPGYLRLPPLTQTGTQSSTPQAPQIGYLSTEALTYSLVCPATWTR